MATFVSFRGYGVHGTEIEVDVDRVTHFYSISYNGNYGVELALDTGKVVQVDGYVHDVRKRIADATAQERQLQ